MRPLAPFVVGDPINERVQGIEASLDDLVLRDGRRLHIELGGAVLKTPTLKRTIGGGSAVELDIHDRELGFLDASLLAEDWDAQLDGLDFRYLGADLREDGIGIVLKDRDIAVLEEQTEHRAAFRKDMTRARFLVTAVEEVLPQAKVTCPQIDEIQPVETEKQGKKAAADSKANKGKGIGDTKHLTVKGIAATPEQIQAGERALRVAESLKAPQKAAEAMMLALIVESVLGIAASNWYEAEPFIPGNHTDLEEMTKLFLTGYSPGEPGAIGEANAHPDLPPYEITQNVQRSGAGEASHGAANYGPWADEARAWVAAASGGEFSAAATAGTTSTEVVEPYKFELCAEEEGKRVDANWWEGFKRLAKEVNWRVFWVAGRFFYIDEIELMRQAVRLAINRETPGIQSVTGKWRRNRPGTELRIEAFASKWKVPPGGVVTLEGYGPFSIGFGDAPLRKGEVGISNNRVAATGVGRARYLLESIESPLRDKDVSELRRVVLSLRKPTAPLPEPAADRKTVSTKSGGVGYEPGPAAGQMGVLAGTPEDVVNEVIDYAHSHGFPEVTRESVRAANAVHGPTVSGGLSDHQGPPDERWAADISNGVSTQEEADLAAAIASAFDIPYHGTLTDGELAEATHQGYRMQLIHNTMTGGDHYNHVHFGCAVA